MSGRIQHTSHVTVYLVRSPLLPLARAKVRSTCSPMSNGAWVAMKMPPSLMFSAKPFQNPCSVRIPTVTETRFRV